MKKVKLLLALFSVVAFCNVSLAQDGKDIDSKVDKMVKHLALNEKQETNIRSIFKEYMPKIQSANEDAKEALKTEMKTKIKGQLTDEQISKWKLMSSKDSSNERAAAKTKVVRGGAAD